ncbi:hypothetical protein C5Y96_26270 [Blastopirellula marina]|uniref:SH3b domain-containing protein n=1 Tax=Blastopirellula marina TaxID=124 RepID=A0A2S8EYN1_9BACT|nr:MULTISPECIES: hypothetical protein [Pirellulaceae]PQO25013.1 hypothetical protein C5Y96_26270 [Blastopirellula marina]RCS40865.1 hypothetical protein DTL36_26320 [Bremerella cremea]
MFCFRPLCLLMLAGILPCAATALASEPYKGRITTAQVFTRSGPGQNYYPTAYLEKNTVVDVYREDVGGWLAIRPTENEFSLVRAEDLSYGDDRRIAHVRTAEAPAFVGSQISDQHHITHVKLDQDEPLEVLGIVELRDPQTGKKEAFYRIAPPAGEFRWINKHFVEAIGIQPRPQGPTVDSAAMAQTLQDDKFWTANEEKLSAVRPVSFDEEADRPGANITGELQPLDEIGPGTSLNLIELELHVSRECIKPVDEWNFKPLKDQAKRLIVEGETPLERGKARLLLEKIEQFNELYERKLATKEAISAASIPLKTPLVSDEKLGEVEPSSDPAASFKEDGFDPRYDGKGWLMPVITRASSTRNPNQYTPPFALTDAQGNVLQFVSPSPGLNLRRYARMQVGIYGQISPLDQYTKQHLTAHRIVVLSRHEKK